MLIVPDRRWVTKQWLMLGTTTIALVVCAVIAHLAIDLTVTDAEAASFAILATWLGVAAGVVLIWAISVPVVLLWFRTLSYQVEADKIIIKKGVLTKTQQNIPINMVTDFRLQRTLYDRALGIGSILIQTAGQSANVTRYEGKLTSLLDWDGLHEDLRHRIRHGGPSRLETMPGEPLEEILVELREIHRVLEKSS